MPDSSYLDLATKRQSILERVKSGQVKDYGKVIKRIERLIKRTLSDLDQDLDELSFTQLNRLLRALRVDQGEIYLAGNIEYNKQLATIATVSASQELLDLTATVDLRGTVLKPFTKQKLYADVLKQPLNANGQLMEVFIRDFSVTENKRVTDAIRNGHALGRTNQEMIRELVGTKSANFKDGILQTTRRNAESMVRTATQHVSSAAQHEVWTSNRNVVAMYKFVATLDRRTSDICRTLDGQEFEFGKGPIPPVHIRCRSRTIPVLNDNYRWLSKGRTRSAVGGPVSAQTSYYDWLKRQDNETVKDVLGRDRAKLFLDGGLTNEQFRKLQFDKNFMPLTLDGMKSKQPEAFKAAGL
jgi:SPP1 gp7 family putative phage head morphogenesis protein